MVGEGNTIPPPNGGRCSHPPVNLILRSSLPREQDPRYLNSHTRGSNNPPTQRGPTSFLWLRTIANKNKFEKTDAHNIHRHTQRNLDTHNQTETFPDTHRNAVCVSVGSGCINISNRALISSLPAAHRKHRHRYTQSVAPSLTQTHHKHKHTPCL